MKISIAMATYNGSQYIREQLQSFVDQTLQPDELIVTDDCSSDQTEAIVREFALTAPFKVEFHRNEKNLGYCGNFNAALMRSTGDLVFLSDQDDVWFPEKINHMVEIAKLNPQALVMMNDAALTDGELRDAGLTKIGQIRSAGLQLNSFVMGCCCAVRKDLLDICLPIPGDYRAHDNWIVAFAEAFNAKIIEERVLQYYRRHGSNESQFIANRLTKVNRAEAWAYSFKNRVTGDSLHRAHRQAQQLEILVYGVERALSVAQEFQKNRLYEMQKSCSGKLGFLKNRITVREKSLFPRVYSVLKMAAEGQYRGSSGVKAILGDIVG